MRATATFIFSVILAVQLLGQAAHGEDLHPLTPAELQARIVGNTLEGKYEDGISWREYYDPSGEIRGRDDKRGSYVAHYAIKGIYICFDYAPPDSDWCGALSAKEDQIEFYSDSGHVSYIGHTAVVKGNPYGL